MEVPSTLTVTPMSGSPDSSTTLPLTVSAQADIDPARSMTISNAMQRNGFFTFFIAIKY